MRLLSSILFDKFSSNNQASSSGLEFIKPGLSSTYQY